MHDVPHSRSHHSYEEFYVNLYWAGQTFFLICFPLSHFCLSCHQLNSCKMELDSRPSTLMMMMPPPHSQPQQHYGEQQQQQPVMMCQPVSNNTAEEQGASFLMTLKSRSISPELIEDSSKLLAEKMMENEPHAHGFNSIPRSLGIPLAMPEDEYWLSDLQCFIRSKCCEFFVADDSDTPNNSASSKSSKKDPASTGRGRTPITVGRVGIRCVFCRDGYPSAKAAQATSFPSQISSIYGSMIMIQCRHFPTCPYMPESVRQTLETMKGTRGCGNVSPPLTLGSSNDMAQYQQSSDARNIPGRQQYWAEAARKMGLVDTEDGVRFAPNVDPVELAQQAHAAAAAAKKKENDMTVVPANHFTPLDVNASGSFESDVHSTTTGTASLSSSSKSSSTSNKKGGPLLSGLVKTITPDFMPQHEIEELEVPDLTLPSTLSSLMGETDLVENDDKDLVPDYLFLAMSQLKRCALNESDKVGCYKDREVGFLGMSCKHCGGAPGFGKYFPATVRSLAQTTTSQTILKHVGAKCRQCPPHIRHAIIALNGREDAEKSAYARGPVDDGRPRYGSRKVFFQRVWARLHGEEVPDLPSEEDLAQLSAPNKSKSKSSKKSKTSKKKKAAVAAATAAAAAVVSTAAPGASLITPNSSEDCTDGVASLDGSGSLTRSVSESSASTTSSGYDDDSIVSEIRSTGAQQQQEVTDVLKDDKNRRVTVTVGGDIVFSGNKRRSRNVSMSSDEGEPHAHQAKKMRT